MQARLREIDTAIQDLTAERDRIDAQMQQLHLERTSIREELGLGQSPAPPPPPPPGSVSRLILRLLGEHEAHSKSAAVQRRWLDEPLVGKVASQQAVSWDLITLKKKGKIDYEKRAGGVLWVWLI